MYMWHLFVFRILFSGDAVIKGYKFTSQFANENFVWIRFIYILAIIMAVSCLSYLIIERPFLAMKAKLTKNRNDVSTIKYFRLLVGCLMVVLFFNCFIWSFG
jgi:peptidoglycan/LPS O-acetylase OafA/YrhL